MSWQSKRTQSSTPDTETPVIEYDDGGSGLLLACRSRFASSGCEISCDVRHTVWISTADGTRSVGLPPWQLSRHPIDELLDNVEAKLELSAREL